MRMVEAKLLEFEILIVKGVVGGILAILPFFLDSAIALLTILLLLLDGAAVLEERDRHAEHDCHIRQELNDILDLLEVDRHNAPPRE